MIPPTSIDGTDITGATIDGTDVQEITVDGDVVFSAATTAPLVTNNLIQNYDARTLSLSNGQSVSQWTDSSGNGFTASANGNVTYDANALNGNPAVDLDGSDGTYLNISNVPTTAEFTQTFLINFPPVTSINFNYFYGAGYDNNSSYNLIGEDDIGGIFVDDSGNLTVIPSISIQTNVFILITYVSDGNGNLDRYIDGNNVSTDSIPTFSTTTHDHQIGYAFPRNFGSRAYTNALYAQLLRYDRALTSTELAQNRSYFNNEWGISV